MTGSASPRVRWVVIGAAALAGGVVLGVAFGLLSGRLLAPDRGRHRLGSASVIGS